MADEVKLSCTFGTETVLSPTLDLYTCNNSLFSPPYQPPNIVLSKNSNGDISYNINDYISRYEPKTKCYWDKVVLYLR